MASSMPVKSHIVITVVLVLSMVFTWLPQLDELARQQVDAGLQRALLTFGIAKGLDAAISVAQSAQFSVNLGVGMALTVGEVLDPLNDLVEQFSSCILVAAVAFGVQKILLALGAYAGVKIVLSVLAGLGLFYSLKKRQPPGLLVYAFGFMLLVRFALPLITLAGNALFEHFMLEQYQASQAAMSTAAADFNAVTAGQFAAPLSAPAVPKEQGFWETLKSTVPSLPGAADLQDRVAGFKQQVAGVTEKIVGVLVSLLVVFLLQTLVFPVLILWLLYRLAGGLLSALG